MLMAHASALLSAAVVRRWQARCRPATVVLVSLALAAISPVAVTRAAVPAPPAAADSSTTPSQLWQQFPLGSPRRDIGPGAGGSTTPGTRGAGGSRTGAAGGSRGSSPDSGSGFSWLWLLLLVPVAALAALFLAGARKPREPAWAGTGHRAGPRGQRDPPYRELLERSKPPPWLRERDPSEGGLPYELTGPRPPIPRRRVAPQPASSASPSSAPWPGQRPQPAPARGAPAYPPQPQPAARRAAPPPPPQPAPVPPRAAPTSPGPPTPAPLRAAPTSPPEATPARRRPPPPQPGPPRAAPTRRPQPAPAARRAAPTPPPRPTASPPGAAPSPAPSWAAPTPPPAPAPAARRQAASGPPSPADRTVWEPPRPPTLPVSPPPAPPSRRGDSARRRQSDAAAAESALPPAPPPSPTAEPTASWLLHDQPDASQTEAPVRGKRPLPEVTNAPAAPPNRNERPEAFAPPEPRPPTPSPFAPTAGEASPAPEVGEEVPVTIEWAAIDPDAPATQPPTAQPDVGEQRDREPDLGGPRDQEDSQRWWSGPGGNGEREPSESQPDEAPRRRFVREGMEDRAGENGREDEPAPARSRHPALPPKRVGRPRSPRTLWRKATGRDSRS